ncbi:unnamed protein product, partial [Ixodes persulcatus]
NSSGTKWKQRRRMLTPAFHFRILEDFVAPMNEHARNMVKRISHFSESYETDVVPFLATCTLAILLETIMGVTTGKYNKDIGSYIDAINLTGQVVARSQTPWLQLDSIYLRTDAGGEYKRRVSVVHSFTKKVRVKFLFCRRSSPRSRLMTSMARQWQRRRFDDLTIDLFTKGRWATNLGKRTLPDSYAPCFSVESDYIEFACVKNGIPLHLVQRRIVHNNFFFSDNCEKKKSLNSPAVKPFSYLCNDTQESQRLCPAVPLIGRTATEELKLGK